MEIRRLSEEVVHQIAAGEVLERPANLVKELVENSIDANASFVKVKVSKDVRSFTIQDDGNGIEKKDLPLALERHATSKITSTSDLWELSTFGFRGEALSCVAAVSDLRIISQKKGKDAFEIRSEFGKISKPVTSSGVEGTTIQIDQLFENVPARLKFLKSEAGEMQQIKKVFRAFALSYPWVHFQLFYDDRMLFDLPVQTERKYRVENLLEIKEMYETRYEVGDYKVHAVFTSPNDVQRTSQNIWVFVKNRWIVDRSIQSAILSAYDSLLMHGEFPQVCVWIDCNPQDVDVNVHPTKSQVKFREPSAVFRLVREALKQELEKAPWRKVSVQDGLVSAETKMYDDLKPQSLPEVNFEFSTTQFAQKTWEEPQPQDSLNSILSTYQNKKEEKPAPSLVSNSFEVKPYWGQLQVLGQSNLTYIIAQSASALILVDQHAAHERIAYEKLMVAWKSGKVETQTFLFPYELDIEEAAKEKIYAAKAELEKLGFELQMLANNTLAIISAPALVKDHVIGNTMVELASQIMDLEDSTAFERKIGDICATIACHSVIRAGQALSHPEMQALLQQMDEFPLSTFCPHGRPVFVEFSFTQLDKSFGRILG
ncbi:MAG: DNA mismatch repair endonuclease MutL [Bdellovibrionales bacterium]|nr:DNA mismatch repair endonuclease MutL [Bdellovibrionales bacterium]